MTHLPVVILSEVLQRLCAEDPLQTGQLNGLVIMLATESDWRSLPTVSTSVSVRTHNILNISCLK